jgi:fumarylacetoacetate (FAA) hydrolase family protein
MNNRQIKLYNNMNKREQEIFDHLVNVKNRKPDDVFFFLHSTFNPSRDDFKKPSFANLSTEQVTRTCQQLQLKDAA